jgi:hypothetical protein
MKLQSAVIASLLAAAPAGFLSGQENRHETTSQVLSVFLDCNAPNCDYDHFRREITWVNWVRDRTDGDVHLLITAERTGGGGWFFSLAYLDPWETGSASKVIPYVSDADATDAETREGLTQTMALGLVHLVDTTSVAPRLRVVYREPGATAHRRENGDPWNLWVFRLNTWGSLEGEAQQGGYSIRGSADASRVSEDHKINVSLSGRRNRDTYEHDDGDETVNISENYSVNVLSVWSLGDNWSAGAKANADRSTYMNRDLTLSLGPAIEYNVFPYGESTRRQFTFRYSVEAASFNYEQETVEAKLSEVLPRHSLLVAAAAQQPWGEIRASVEGIQYLHDPATHRINTDVNIEWRLFRGFSLDVWGDFSRIKDQFYLPSEGLTPEEVLLRRRARESNYSYDISVGFSYRFGSKFANIVNPRMGGNGRRRH